MGFAGQVFAARVAIGLAFPSKQAMGQASQIIGAGASALYKKMNSMSVRAASQRRKSAETELTQIQSRVEKHRKSLGSKLKAGQEKFTSSLARANLGAKITAGKSMAQYKKTQQAMGSAKGAKHIENTFKAGKRAFTDFATHVKQRSPDLAIKLFGEEGDLENIHDSFDFQKLSDLFAETGKEAEGQQKEVVKIAQLEMENAKRRQRNGEEEIKMMRLKTKWLMQTGQIEKTAGLEGLDLLDEESRGFKDNVSAASDFYGVVKGMADQRATDAKTHATKLQEYLAEEKSARQIVKDAIKGETVAIKLLEQGAKKAAKKAAQLAEALKNNFGNALRESISALTAMFYKLQQNTQELVEFERELMNANSVFNLTRKELYETSEVITQFGQTFGMEMQNGAEGLYQLASAGLTADQSMKVLPSTLKLSMAVQGDHNTIAKLTTQTLLGFSMEMEQAAEVTDKFAHVIQKSLIEYEDLSSAVKFAMPFFTATGQSVDQLLGALEILTNRALEAGIAGRGLRQALAEFAEHADDNTAAFARMGLEIKKADGSMKDLTVIAKEYSDIIGPDAASNTKLLTSLIEDLNVRGATAFVHLVQNADEFATAVENVENAGGELDEMVRIQNESMSAQIQILKNNVQMLFFYNDGIERVNGGMNEFHSAILDGIKSFQDLLVEGEEGNKTLTEFGKTIQEVAVEAVRALITLLKEGVQFLGEFSGSGKTAIGILKAYLLPIKVLMKVIDIMGPKLTSLVIQFSMLNKLFSLTAGIRATVQGFIGLFTWLTASKAATDAETKAVTGAIAAKTTEIGVNEALSASEGRLAASRGQATLAAQGEAGASGGAGAVDASGMPIVGGKGAGGAKTPKITGSKKAGYGWEGKKGRKFATKDAAKAGHAKKFGTGAKATKAVGSAAKIGKLAMAMQGLYTVAGYVAAALGTVVGAIVAIVAIIVVAIAAFVAWGVQLMGIMEPIKTMFVDFGHGVANMWAAIMEKMSGVVDWMVKIGLIGEQTAQTIGYVGYSVQNMGDVAKDALSEMGWWFKKVGMDIAMRLGGVFGYLLYVVSDMFKNIYDIVMYYIGNSVITDAIVDGFTSLYWKLFDPADGWLRWLTLTWWSDAFTALSTWWDGGQVVLDTFDSAMDFGQAMFGSILTFIEELPAKLTGIAASMKNAISLTAIFGIDAFKTAWNALSTMMSNIEMEIDIGGFSFSAPDWVPGIGGEGWGWAGYNEKITLGTWPLFAMEAAASTADTSDPLVNRAGRQTGGYVKAMASGGYLGNGSYLVGEQGPEMFMPNQAGQVINNQRTESILRDQLDGGVDANIANTGSGLQVANLQVGRLTAGKSRIRMDVFGGVA
tara:strand:- start:10263 stop:14291 length:4029 start_codon:yes stop_codon:yes gene_type:complete